MSEDIFQWMQWAMCVLALIVFVCLFFINAGYGQFRSRKWGWSINNKLAWTMMEAPVFIVMLCIWRTSGWSLHIPELILLLLFLLHYFQRSFIFPFLMTGKSKMPVAIMLMGITFNIINGVMQGGGLYWFPNPEFQEGTDYLLRFNSIVGIALFFIGFAINLHSDHVIRNLRKPGDTRHYLPQKGMYRYVTSANYLGEIVEWVGFALFASTTVAWVFPLWTASNLVPRAHSLHKHYRTEFGEKAVGGRKRIFPFLY